MQPVIDSDLASQSAPTVPNHEFDQVIGISIYICRSMTKQTKCSEHPAKTQIRLGGSAQCPVWSGPSLCVEWIAKDPRHIHADGEDSHQTGRMHRLIWVFTGRTCHFIGFVMLRLILSGSQKSKWSEVSWVNVVSRKQWDAVQKSLNPFTRSYGREKGNIDLRRRRGNEEN